MYTPKIMLIPDYIEEIIAKSKAQIKNKWFKMQELEQGKDE